MTTVYFIAAIAAVLGGLLLALVLHIRGSTYRIHPLEFVIGVVAITAVTTPLVNMVGTRIARNGAVGGYVEFWNGSIVAAESSETACTRDGSCVREYQCDPYTVTEQVPYTTTQSDGRGGTTTVTRYRTETRTEYHSCPYVTHEYSYWLADSLDQTHFIAQGIFSDNPVAWRAGEFVPAEIPRGVPKAWTEAKERLEAGHADPVTKTNKYANYLLAAQESLLQEHSADIDKYRKLFPDHTRNIKGDPIHDGYKADKFLFVGAKGPAKLRNDAAWQDTLARLNARLGSERQGDLHVVAVHAPAVDDPDAYTNALIAYYQSRETFNKRSLSKNAVLLVVGVNPARTEVEWARGKTGVPVGNNEMLQAFALTLKGEPFEPTKLLGAPDARAKNGKPVYSSGDGAVERIMLKTHPFKRPCMDCEDEGESGSLVYLKSSSFIPTGSKVAVFVVDLLAATAVWALLVYLPLFEPIRTRSQNRDLRRRATDDHP